jgi:methionyl-tRNA formyltransferase
LNPFSIAFFSDPPVAVWVLPELLNSGIPVSSIVSIVPSLTKLDFPVAIQQAADARKIPFFRPDSLRSEDFLGAFMQTGPAVIACMSFLRKIPPEVLRIAPLGGINCHPAPLPKYRGSFPYFWIIMNGDKEASVTVHEMTEEFDAGDIHFTESYPVETAETAGTLMTKSARQGIRLLIKALSEIQAGRSLPRTPQNPANVTFARFPNFGELEIRWNQNAERILTLIRAASPHLGAFTVFRNVALKVWSARLSRPNTASTRPGTLIVSGGITEVAALDYCLELEVMQLELLRFYSGKEFAMLKGIQDGEVLGQN